MNIIDFFTDYDIEYWERGKNVSPGWVNIQCVFPMCDDHSNHLGVNKKTLHVSCWKCGGHSIISLIMAIAQCSFPEAKEIHNSLGGDNDYYHRPPMSNDTSSVFSDRVILPPESTIHFPKMHTRYLMHRGLKPRRTIRKYKLQAVHNTGKYKFRIIIPIFVNKVFVCFTSRDVTDMQDPPYLHASPEETILNAKKVIYNYDTVVSGGDAFLTEGPIDAWKMGDGAMSLLGVKHTEDQVKLIVKKNINRLFILFDNDKAGKKDARKLGKIMAPLVKKVEILTLQRHGDPGELTISEARAIKDSLDFNN